VKLHNCGRSYCVATGCSQDRKEAQQQQQYGIKEYLYCYLIHFCNTFDDNNRSVSWKRATAIFGIMCLQDTGKQCLHQSALTSHWVMLLISANRTEFAHISESADVNFGLINIHTFCFIHFGLAFILSYSHSNGD